ncbi:MAG TPA: M55 family metallopeptidase [Anaerolineales bacterium]
MKILIAADMEGITGVTNWDQVNPAHSEYARFRRIMTQDVNAAVRGALAAGADDILVTDGHAHGNNILLEELNPRARLSSGNASPLAMVQGVDTDVDGVLLIGYHACAGSKNSILDHTWASSSVANVWLNDNLVGEVGLNAAVCGHFNVPVLMVSGDQTVCGEARELLGLVEVAVVKHASGRMSAECLPPEVAQDMICEAASHAIIRLRSGQAVAPFRVNEPVNVRVEFFQSDMGDRAALLPGARRLSAKMIELTTADMVGAYTGFRSAVSLARP